MLFDETPVAFYDDTKTKLYETSADIRNLDKDVVINGITVNANKRIFCKDNLYVNTTQYVKFDNQTYKIIKIRPHIDYYEIWLYQCEVISI